MESINKTSPLVSVIIVNWNGNKILADCLRSLDNIDYSSWELILVDNGSTDGSEKIPSGFKKRHSYKVIKNDINLGFAQANNQGVEYAHGEYVLLLNNDTKVEKNFLSRLVDRIEKDVNLAVIQPKILLMNKKGYLDNAGSYLTKIGFLKHWGFMEEDGPEFDQEREIFSAKGACMLIRKKVVKELGLFDKLFFSYFEESDFCWRVWLRGYKILFYPHAVIYHKLGFTIRRLNAVELNYHYYKNRIRSLIKNLDSKNIFIVLFPHIIISFGIAAIFLLRLKFKNTLMIIKAIGWNLFYLFDTLNLRKVIQSERKVSDDLLFQTLSKNIDWLKYWHDFKRVEKDIDN